MEAKAIAKFPVRLDVLGPDNKVRHSCEYVKEKIVLGRILSADLRIDDKRVSRIHALLEVRGDQIQITDLASTHGTFVNGKKIVDAKLKPGDVIRLGVIEIRLEKGSGKASASPVPALEGEYVSDGEETYVDIARPSSGGAERREKKERREQDAFPEETRTEDRREKDRRAEERRTQVRRTGPGGAKGAEAAGVSRDRRVSTERREPEAERRVGERRRKDRRVFDITSLERRIEDRRKRKSDDDLLPEELEAAFEAPAHARELEVTVLWGDHILDVSNYNEAKVLSVGEDPKNHYIIPSVGIPEEFPLVTIEDDGNAYLAFTEEMSGTVRARDQIFDLVQLKDQKFVKRQGGYYYLGLKQDDFAKLAIGNINFFILYVKPAPRIRPAPLFDRDKLFLRTFISSLLTLLLLMLALALIPEPVPVTIEMMPEHLARIVIKKKPSIKIPEAVKEKTPMQEGSKVGAGTKAKEPEGKPEAPKVAEKVAPPKKTAAKAQPTPTPVKPKAPPKPVEQEPAKSVGLLRAFKSSSVKSEMQKLLSKEDAADVFGKNWRANREKISDSLGGASGQGLQGVQTGAGGKTIGIDGPTTTGLGSGASGDSGGEGFQGTGRLGKKGEYSVNIISENVQVLSGLPKDVINAVVQRHRNEIRQCYEASRQRNPGLRGKVVVRFTIQPDGVVSAASVAESTVGDSTLESCVVSRVRRWLFPKPEAPVVTEVSAYPFYLNPGN